MEDAMVRRGTTDRGNWLWAALSAVLIGLFGAPGLAFGTPYTLCAGRGGCVAPAAGPTIPAPERVPGKEHTTDADRHTGNAPPAPGPGCPANPGQDVAWDGLGGTDDSFDYEPGDAHETDAHANRGDALFDEVVADTAALIFSVEFDPDLTVEPVAAVGGAAIGRTWAPAASIEGMCGAADIDAVELWGDDGPPGSDDATRFSRFGDPFDPVLPPVGGRTSIHAHPGAVPLCATAALAASIGALYGATPAQLADLEAGIDLDAMMVDGDPEQSTGDTPSPGTAPTKLIWSVRPIAVAADPGGGNPAPISLDGGEIFVGDCLGGPAVFLTHGGHVWDTPFPVMATFGLVSENVNALEAVANGPKVPTLGPVALVGLTAAMGGLAWLRLRRSRRG
jgi:hypothetical protein